MKYIAYFRVSTKQQEASGLGIDSQKSIVTAFINESDTLIAEYTEIESGKRNDRPELLKAIEHCKADGAVLLIAKLDRLSRNAGFILALRDNNVDFKCCDMPDANRFTIGIFALLAEQEREFISNRTKAALAEKKRQGAKLGKPENLTEAARARSLEVRQKKALNNSNNQRAKAMIKSLNGSGQSLRQIAEVLNNSGFKTSRGKEFRAEQVKRLMINNL